MQSFKLHIPSKTNSTVSSTWSPGVAACLAVIIPGLGHIYKGKLLAGIAWFFFIGLGYIVFVVPGMLLHLFSVFSAFSHE